MAQKANGSQDTLLQAGGERPEPDSLLFLAGSILLALVVCFGLLVLVSTTMVLSVGVA